MNIDKKNVKKFCGIQFSDNSHEVVPREWLKKEMTKCLWPKNNDVQEVRLRAPGGLAADDSWELIPIKLLTHSKTFAGCEKKLYAASETDGFTSTDCSSSTEEIRSRIRTPSPLLPRCNAMPSEKRCKKALDGQELSVELSQLKQVQEENSKKLDKILFMLHQEKLSQAAAKEHLSRSTGLPPPAETLDQLDVLLQTPTLLDALKELQGRSSSDTVRRIIRRLMSKQLALSFSWTGLGPSRKPTKISFRDHQAGKLCYDAWKFCYPPLTFKDFSATVATVLKSVPDWDGGRSRSAALACITAGNAQNAAEASAGPSTDTMMNCAQNAAEASAGSSTETFNKLPV